MPPTVSVTESNLFTAMRGFILSLVDCEVTQALGNRVPTPRGEFIALTASLQTRLGTNHQRYGDATKSFMQPTQWSMQVDCYGANANDRALTLSMMMRSEYACEIFKSFAYDIQPLYATDPQQLPIVDGEQQYEERWMFNAVLQYNPVISIPQQFVTEISVGIKNVDVSYPPGA